MSDSQTPAWMEPLARDVVGSADQDLINQMLALGEDVSDRELWVERRLQLFAVVQAMMAGEAKRIVMAEWTGASDGEQAP